MKIILNKEVYNLGEEGDVKEVKPGYARNYLFPRELAYPYNKQFVAMFEGKKKAIQKKKADKLEEAKGMKDKLESLNLVLAMPAGDTGKLFGSVSNLTIAEALEKEGFSIERKKIELIQHNLKMIGNYTAKIKLYQNEAATLNFTIVDQKKDSADASKKEAVEKVVEAAADEVTEEVVSEEAAVTDDTQDAADEA